MEIGNEEIKIDGMGNHVARLALEIRNDTIAQGQRFLSGEHVTTLSDGLGQCSDLSCRSRRSVLRETSGTSSEAGVFVDFSAVLPSALFSALRIAR